jgi:hypothetical protein
VPLEGDEAELGVVRQTQYLGMSTRVTVALADGTELLASWAHTHAAADMSAIVPGAAIMAAWRKEDAYALQD